MIDFRYHLVSIVAVFLALAIGIVLGSTELQGPTYNFLNRTTATLQTELDQVSGQRDTAQAEAAVGEAYAQAVQPVVLHNLLAGQRLLIITEPGAPASVVTAITGAATADAGATVTGQIALQQKFFDTSDTTLDALNQINLAMAPTAGIQLNNGTSYQEQAAQVIASEILTKSAGTPALQQTGTPTGGTTTGGTTTGGTTTGGTTTGGTTTGGTTTGGTTTGGTTTGSSTTGSTPSAGTGNQQDTSAQTMLAAYANYGFLTTSGQPYTQATLAVIVTPQNVPADGSADPLDQVLVSLAGETAAKDSGTVVAGTSTGSGQGSPIAFLRSNNVANQVSTVDDADLVSGQSVVIQALAVLLNGGKAGSYGFAANGATAVAPSPAPTPSVSVSPSPSPSPTSKKKVK